MVEFLLVALILLAIPFVLPIAAWVSARRTRTQLETLVRVVESQEKEIDDLRARVAALGSAPAAAQAPAPGPGSRLSQRHPQLRSRRRLTCHRRSPCPCRPRCPGRSPNLASSTAASRDASDTAGAPDPGAAAGDAGCAIASRGPSGAVRAAAAAANAARRASASATASAATQPPGRPAFDWESLVGVKLFSAIAGVALVIAAVLFLRYSIEAGWLQPPVRVAIGILVAIALLVVCELKAARRYPVTANAMDAAAIAILFATFFAAHALWNLIPALVAFGLLALVTALAVLLSIRRESLFIAVLGLLGGFATPALLSTGENRPIPLFAYLLLLNVGLAQVAYTKRWPMLTGLTLVLTAIYQWGWVFKFLDASSVPLAMGIFLLFPLAAFAGLADRGTQRRATTMTRASSGRRSCRRRCR